MMIRNGMSSMKKMIMIEEGLVMRKVKCWLGSFESDTTSLKVCGMLLCWHVVVLAFCRVFSLCVISLCKEHRCVDML